MNRSILISALLLPVAFLCAGVSMIWRGIAKDNEGKRKSWFPKAPTAEKLREGMPPLTIKTAFHWLVNIAVEWVRADPQWWTKFLGFVCFASLVVAIFI